MLTNIIASILVSVVTNTVVPTQYYAEEYLATYPLTVKGRWVDEKFYGLDWNKMGVKTRPNPNVKFVEVHRIRTLEFTVENESKKVLLEDKIISKTKHERTVVEVEEWKTEDVSHELLTAAICSTTNMCIGTNNIYLCTFTNETTSAASSIRGR
jgi:hypothetical protein